MVAIRAERLIAREEHFRLGSYVIVDPVRNCILRDGRRISVEPRVMQLLVYLAARPGHLVSKRELMDEVWRANVVDEAIQRAVSLLRSAVGDSAQNARFVETVPGRGYRLLITPALIHPRRSWPEPRWIAASVLLVGFAGVAVLAGLSSPLPPAPAPARQAAQPIPSEQVAATKHVAKSAAGRKRPTRNGSRPSPRHDAPQPEASVHAALATPPSADLTPSRPAALRAPVAPPGVPREVAPAPLPTAPAR